MIRYSIYMNDADSSFGQKDLDLLLDEYNNKNSKSVKDIFKEGTWAI